jgi:hypothetical protein
VYLLCGVLDPLPYMILLGSKYTANMRSEPVVEGCMALVLEDTVKLS